MTDRDKKLSCELKEVEKELSSVSEKFDVQNVFLVSYLEKDKISQKGKWGTQEQVNRSWGNVRLNQTAKSNSQKEEQRA